MIKYIDTAAIMERVGTPELRGLDEPVSLASSVGTGPVRHARRQAEPRRSKAPSGKVDQMLSWAVRSGRVGTS